MSDHQANLALLDATLPNGCVVKVEAEVTGSAQDVALLPAFSLEGLEQALAGFAEITNKAAAKAAPDSIELELGLKLGLEGGKIISILAHAKSEASLTVRLGWHRQVDKPTVKDDGSSQSPS